MVKGTSLEESFAEEVGLSSIETKFKYVGRFVVGQLAYWSAWAAAETALSGSGPIAGAAAHATYGSAMASIDRRVWSGGGRDLIEQMLIEHQEDLRFEFEAFRAEVRPVLQAKFGPETADVEEYMWTIEVLRAKLEELRDEVEGLKELAAALVNEAGLRLQRNPDPAMRPYIRRALRRVAFEPEKWTPLLARDMWAALDALTSQHLDYLCKFVDARERQGADHTSATEFGEVLNSDPHASQIRTEISSALGEPSGYFVSQFHGNHENMGPFPTISNRVVRLYEFCGPEKR